MLIPSFSSVSTIINTSNLTNGNENFYTHEYSQRHAMIVVGVYQEAQFYTWYLKAAMNLYLTLTDVYGFSDSEVHVLLTIIDGWTTPEIFNESIVDLPSTKANIQSVLNDFKSGGEYEVPSDGLFLFTWIGHGSKEKFVLNGGEQVSSNELKTYIEGINGRNVIILQPCMSGSFIDELSKPGRVVCSSVGPISVEGGWIESFIRGLNGAADSRPADGRISIEEAFYHAADHVSGEFKLSRLEDTGDGVPYGPYWFPENYDINDPYKDGYRASRIYDLSYEEFEMLVFIEYTNVGKVDEGYKVEFTSDVMFGISPYTYLWDFGDEEQSTEENPDHYYDEKGTYSISLNVTDNDGNSICKTINIEVKKSKLRTVLFLELIKPLFEKISRLIKAQF